jgi:hypothetical protein
MSRLSDFALGAALRCRNVAVTLISGLVSRLGYREIEDRIAALPLRDQVLVVGGVLAALFLLSLLAAQAGWIGLLLFWLGVVVVAR